MLYSELNKLQRIILKSNILKDDRIESYGPHSCLLWQPTLTNMNRYGHCWHTFKDHRISVSVHRAVYYGTHYEEIPNENIVISHLCHTKRCVRPEHLRAESYSENQKRNKCKDRDIQVAVKRTCLGSSQHGGAECLF